MIYLGVSHEYLVHVRTGVLNEFAVGIEDNKGHITFA